MYNIRKLIESYAIILSAHYLIVFVLMVVIYAKLLKHIKKIGSAFGKFDVQNHVTSTSSVFFLFIQTRLMMLLVGEVKLEERTSNQAIQRLKSESFSTC